MKKSIVLTILFLSAMFFAENCAPNGNTAAAGATSGATTAAGQAAAVTFSPAGGGLCDRAKRGDHVFYVGRGDMLYGKWYYAGL